MHGFVWTVHVQTSLHTYVMYSIKSVVIETEKLGASLTIKGDLIATALWLLFKRLLQTPSLTSDATSFSSRVCVDWDRQREREVYATFNKFKAACWGSLATSLRTLVHHVTTLSNWATGSKTILCLWERGFFHEVCNHGDRGRNYERYWQLEVPLIITAFNYAVCSNVFFTPWANFRCNNFLEDRFVWNEGKEVQSRAAILNKSRDACWLNFSSYKIFWSLIQPNWAISLDRLCNAIRKRSCCKSYVIMETEE